MGMGNKGAPQNSAHYEEFLKKVLGTKQTRTQGGIKGEVLSPEQLPPATLSKNLAHFHFKHKYGEN